MRLLVGNLIAFNRAEDPVWDGPVAARICEKLRVSITMLAGADGFSALLVRAIALARADVPSLEGVRVTADGSIAGLEQVGDDEAGEIIAHLLGLLTTFIGEPLTMRLLRESWPDAPDRLD